MAHLISILLFFISASAYACPDLTGTYICNQGDPKWEHQVQFTKLNKNSFDLIRELNSGGVWKNKIIADGVEKKDYIRSNYYTDIYTTASCDSTALIRTTRSENIEEVLKVGMLNVTTHKIYSLDHEGNLRYASYNLFSDGKSNSFIKTCKRIN
ncbi:MAG: hypothetical protein MK008_07540 [Bdellovibrionales bacterium]|nr:hypothetical protein [Bdellovibrionales bacterium]